MNDGSSPHVLQGVFEFEGKGLDSPVALGSPTHTVPPGRVAQPVYFRGGNSSDALVYVAFVRDGAPMRLFPIGARAATHVSLRIVEDLLADTVLELHVAAPEGVSGTVVVDAGLVEVWS